MSLSKGADEKRMLSTMTPPGIFLSTGSKLFRSTHSTPIFSQTSRMPADVRASILSTPTMELSPTRILPAPFSWKYRMTPSTTSGLVQIPDLGSALKPVLTFRRTCFPFTSWVHTAEMAL